MIDPNNQPRGGSGVERQPCSPGCSSHVEITCWRCSGVSFPFAPTMRHYADDYWYHYYVCDTCGAEHVEEIPAVEREKPKSPITFPEKEPGRGRTHVLAGLGLKERLV